MIWSIVVAAGAGTRFGDRPKQYETLGDERVVDWSLRAARAVSDGVVLVVAEAYASRAEPGADVVIVGGTSRSASVREGLRAVPEDASVIVVHDAARPMASVELFDAVIGAVRNGADGAVPGLPVTDTIKRVRPPELVEVVDTLERNELVAVQTPQAFGAEALRDAHATGDDATDDAALVERRGYRVVVVAGDPRNAKITTSTDLVSAEAAL